MRDGLAAKLDALHGDITGVISIGLAGALSPLLKVGDVVIADRRSSRAREHLRSCDEGWRVRLAARLPHAHQGSIVRQRCDHRTCRRPRPALYRTHRRAGGGHGIARSRRASPPARNLPLAGLRVISDDAGHALPPAALVAMKPDGGIALGPGAGVAAEQAAADAGADPHRARRRTRRSPNYSAAAISVVLDLPARISDIFFSTWREKTNSAGRCLLTGRCPAPSGLRSSPRASGSAAS